MVSIKEMESENGEDEVCDFDNIYFKVCNYLKAAHGIIVMEKAVVDEPEYLGSYDIENIVLKAGLSNEHKLFLVAHLFGHCVQWCIRDYEECKYIDELMLTHLPSELPQEEINKLKSYEYEAAGYAIDLLNVATNFDLAQWFSDWSHADWIYFLGITSFKDNSKSPADNLKCGNELIPSQKIPFFTLHKILPRYAY